MFGIQRPFSNLFTILRKCGKIRLVCPGLLPVIYSSHSSNGGFQMSYFKKLITSIFIGILLFHLIVPELSVRANSTDPFPFVILSKYKATIDIGDEIHLIAITSNGKMPTWKSSDSKIASVNTYME